MRLVDAERVGGRLQQKPGEGPRGGGVLHPVSFDDVAEQHELDVVLERLDALGQRHRLHFGKAAHCEVAVEMGFEPRPRFGPRKQLGGQRDAGGHDALGEAVRKDLDGEATAAELGGHLGVKELGRRPAHHDLHLFGVEHAPHEARPLGDHLDLVEEEIGTSLACLGVRAIEGLEQPVEQAVGGGLQAVVLEVDVEQVALVHARCEGFSHPLIHQVGLAGAAHADDDARLARSVRQADEAGTAFWDWRLLEFGNEEVGGGHGTILTATEG